MLAARISSRSPNCHPFHRLAAHLGEVSDALDHVAVAVAVKVVDHVIDHVNDHANA